MPIDKITNYVRIYRLNSESELFANATDTFTEDVACSCDTSNQDQSTKHNQGDSPEGKSIFFNWKRSRSRRGGGFVTFDFKRYMKCTASIGRSLK